MLMVAGQKYEVKVVNGKRLMEPIASPLPLRRPLKRAREKKEEEKKKTMEANEANEANELNKLNESNESNELNNSKESKESKELKESKESTTLEKGQEDAMYPPSKRTRTQTIETRSM